MGRFGLLLINLGTPAGPEPGPVRRYLREFLSDPRVLTLPAPLRFLLLHLIILPFRARRSAHAYRAIWTPEGSPLLVHGRALAAKVQALLGESVPVALGMRYQQPSLAAALEQLERAGVDRVVAFPLYPQYASSTWGSTFEALTRLAARGADTPRLQFVPPFFDHPAFLDALAARARPVLERVRPERVVLSFHGLPESHLRATDKGGDRCLTRPDCCERLGPVNRSCYRAHCLATARGVAERLGLEPGRWEATFQSRLGRTPWIRPYTDERLQALAAQGVKRVVVLSPAFVADCLETLEELGLRAREDFIARGGEELALVPGLNAEDDWAAAVVRIARETTGLGAVSAAPGSASPSASP